MSRKEEGVIEEYLFWLLTRDLEFLQRYAKFVHPDTWENPEETWLLDQILEYYVGFDSLIPQRVLLQLLEDKEDNPKFDKEVVAVLYDVDGPDDNIIPWLLEYADQYFRKRLSREVVAEYVDSLDSGTFDDALAVLNKGVSELNQTNQPSQTLDGLNIDEMAERIYALFTDDGRSIATDIPQVDAVMSGGLRPGELGVVLAPPGHGKSQWLTYVARRAVRKNKGVAYFSFEMSEERILMRLYSAIAQIDANEVPTKLPKVVEEMKKFITKHSITNDFFIRRFPDKGATVADLTTEVQNLRKAGHQIDLVVVDYGDIVKPMFRSQRGRVEDQAAVYEDLRAMSIKLDVPVWTASQANRAALHSRVITIEHLADSFDKAKVADYIIAICQDDAEKTANLVRLYYAKVRNHSQGEATYCGVDFNRAHFQQIARQDAEETLCRRQEEQEAGSDAA